MRHILVEGWRGISQSFAMVNQYQLCALARMPGLSLEHRDLPYDRKHWNTTDNAPGFPDAMRQRIAAVPPPSRASYDCVYSIASPFRKSPTPAAKALTFMTGEYGLRPDSFVENTPDIDHFCTGRDEIVVPSRWSKMKALEFGFPEAKVAIVPHGVDADLFSPLAPAERLAARRQIGVPEDDFVFLNLGAMTANKGIDILVRAFARVRRQHPRARLLLKDDYKLYGISAATIVQHALAQTPELVSEDLRKSIVLISNTLTLAQLRLLYGAADAYVSPYRAEGFNLPVIEAIACGTPVIVTAGGATDDFCSVQTAHRIASRKVDNDAAGIPGTGYHMEADSDDLVRLMALALSAAGPTPMGEAAFEAGRTRLIERYSWECCARQLAHLMM